MTRARDARPADDALRQADDAPPVMGDVRPAAGDAATAAPLLVVGLRGEVRVVALADADRATALRRGVTEAQHDAAPHAARGTLTTLRAAGAAFATLRAPDRRPHPACARALLARIDARARATGLRVLVGAPEGGPLHAPQAWCDARAASTETEFALRLALCDDVDEPAGAVAATGPVRDRFARAVRAALPALEAASGATLAPSAEGALVVRAESPALGPHALLAALIAAGVDPLSAHGLRDGPHAPTLAALLGDAVAARLALPDGAPSTPTERPNR